MLTAALLVSVVTPALEPVELYRQWKPKTTLRYQVKSTMFAEQRHYMTSVYIPETSDQNYEYTMEVGAVTSEGFATITYKRPTIEVIQGETAESGSVTRIEKLNEHLLLTMSPVNAMTDVKDLTPKKKEGDGGGKMFFKSTGDAPGFRPEAQDILGQFIGELFRLSLFIGNAETSVDFGPRLPLFEVEPGDTWQITASYQPQALKGRPGKMAAQRLDYLYTYNGIVESGGKKIHRVTAVLKLDTDIAPFVNDLLGTKPNESGLRGLKMKLDAKMEFDLDLVTKDTLAVRADSLGSFAIEITDVPDRSYIEENMKGRTRLKLVSIS